MEPTRDRSPERLIDWVFRDLAEPTVDATETQPPVDQELANQAEELLSPLAAWTAPEPPADLTERIITALDERSPLEVVAASASLSPESLPAAGGPRFPLSLWESLAVAACIALVAVYYLPGMAQVRSKELRALCGNQLAGFYRGVSGYAEAHGGELPSVSEQPVNWLHQPNRRHLAPALRLNFIKPGMLLCPSGPKKDDHGAGPDADNNQADPQRFLGQVSVRFYSLQNRGGPVPKVNQPVSLPMLADPNPMFRNGNFDPLGYNSATHGGEGQNVIFFDGAAAFLKSPVIGTPEDHIWRIEHIDSYDGTETQQSATDAFLIP